MGDAENRLGKLVMGENERIVKYNTKFNQYAALVDWDDRALRFFYRKGLAFRIKEELLHRTEEKSLNDFKVQCSKIDNKYWIFDTKKKEAQRSRDAKENPKGKSKAPSTNTTTYSNTTSYPSTSSSTPSNKSTSTKKTFSSSSSAPSTSASFAPKPYAGVLGKDGRLLDSERKHRREAGLCFFCGGKHKFEDCNKRKKSEETKARAATVAEGKPEASKQEK